MGGCLSCQVLSWKGGNKKTAQQFSSTDWDVKCTHTYTHTPCCIGQHFSISLSSWFSASAKQKKREDWKTVKNSWCDRSLSFSRSFQRLKERKKERKKGREYETQVAAGAVCWGVEEEKKKKKKCTRQAEREREREREREKTPLMAATYRTGRARHRRRSLVE